MSVSLLSVFLGLLDQVVNPAHGPLQALLGVDGGGLQFFAREKNGAKRLGNFPTLHKPLKSPTVLWIKVISGHILPFFLKRILKLALMGFLVTHRTGME